MGRLLLIASITLVLGTLTYAQPRGVPRFSQYTVAVDKGRAHAIKHDSSTRTYRTRLNEAVRGGVNFAGHYIVTGWGCGTGCTNAAIIDARTGKVMWPDEFYNIDARYGDGYSDEQIEYKKNSRMLIIHGRPGPPRDKGPELDAGDYYYEWRNNRLHRLKFVKKD